MGTTAYLFPGQGAQKVGMGQDLFQRYSTAQAIFEEADAVLGYPLSQVCFEGPEEQLRQTVHTQPAIFVVSYVCLKVAQELGVPPITKAPKLLAGHSLGEYTAILAAGSLSFAQALTLVQRRASLMEEAGQASSGAMSAILGIELAALEAVCSETGVQIANINSPEQVVISGPSDAIARANALAQERGARRVVPLEVSGAFHSRLMAPAQTGMAKALEAVTLRDAAVPIVANATATAIASTQDIKRELHDQVCAPVQWAASIEYMVTSGVTDFVEIGPGRVLTGLVKRIAPEASTWNLGDLASLEAAKAA